MGPLSLARFAHRDEGRAHASGPLWRSGVSRGCVHRLRPVLLAQGAVLAGTIANQIFFAGAKLPHFKVEIIGMVADS